VVPNLFHVVPVGHDAVFHGVPSPPATTSGLNLITNVGVLLVHERHDAWVLEAANDGREHDAGVIVTSKASLYHTGAVINHKGLHFIRS
jgi:hypothetical protein